MCVARFDIETKNAFIDLYTKIDAGVDVNADNEASETEDDSDTPETDEENVNQ